ncbi:MAG: hypothetical protein ABI614_22550, partial [Planctomycetota bacterium]
MTTSLKTTNAGLTEPIWHEAMAQFRARAQQLFESQRDRVEFLEASIVEQLATLDQAEPASSASESD